MNPVDATPEYVRQGEKVLWTGKPTLLVLFSNAIGFLVFLLFTGMFLAGNVSRGASYTGLLLPLAAMFLFLFILVMNALRLKRTRYVITDQSIYTRTGLIGRSVIQTTYDKITDIALRQDVVGRIFGYSSLQVNTAGSNTAPVQMAGLQGALQVKQQVEQAREAFLQRGRSREAPPTWQQVPARLPQFTLDRDILLVTCTTTKKRFKRPRSELGKKVKCPVCQKEHIVKEAASARSPR